MRALKIRKIGNSAGVVLPAEVLKEMQIGVGDQVYLLKNQDGIRLTPYDPEFAEQMDTAREIMRRRRQALRELAK